jgi:HEAT repeat protein
VGVLGSYAVRSTPYAEAVRDAAAKLIAALKDREPTVRIAAASALRILAGSASRDTSPGPGRGKGKSTAPKAATATTTVDPQPVAAALLDLLSDRDAEVRQAALFALTTIGPVASDDPPQSLFAAMEDESTGNRAAAIASLAGFSRGLDPLIPLLLRHLEKDEPAVGEACMSALVRIRPSALTSAAATDLIAGLRNRNPDVRLQLVSLLAEISPDPGTAVPALITVLSEPVDSDKRAMGMTTISITYSGPAHQAARALGRVARDTASADAAIAALTEVVRSGPAQRKASAANALGEFGPAGAKAVPALITFLEHPPASETSSTDSEAATRALSRIAPGTPSANQAVAALTAALKSKDSSTRESAVEALKPFGAAAIGTIPTLREMKEKDSIPTLREAAASALEALKDGSK